MTGSSGHPWGGAQGQPPEGQDWHSPSSSRRNSHQERLTQFQELCCGFVWGVLFFGGNRFWFGFFLDQQQHEEEENDDEGEGETHPASTLIWKQKLWDVVWVSDGISSTRSHRGGPATPFDSQQGQAQGRGPCLSPNASRHCRIPLRVGSVLNQGTEGTRVLSSLFLTHHFCLDRNLKQK